ncbi:uncharacterized protein LOC111651810 [Seriola lalandi dorsalis]|uniref:uncharacterized protein LOC111651810 n=1 Tax=Seriola lalandi dorsalis TaxID=1841481 RepID=UPI000C6F7A99|nr:uncharacterized protein LOC111651810 [Seriola lalandi dorsalis]
MLLVFNELTPVISTGVFVSSSDGHGGGGGGAFFALRSCHRLLHGDDSGEFFSPDYLCSNPSLWCNWTVQVDPGKRIHLHLEDLTPDDACHLKQDEIHVDDPAARSGGHKVLQKCWREAKYTSSSDTLQVVLLIGGWPHLPYRGFYGRYHAFGPPVMYNPQDVSESEPGLAPELDGEQMESDSSEHPPTAHSDVFDYYDSAMTAELPWGPEGPEEAADTDAEIVSVSTADVNECGTQLVLCDVNADCVNQFGSYSCRCRPGFLDQSRLGSGGTVCMDVAAAGCGSGLSAETKGIYVLFFLLSSFILMLLAAAGALYRRHHRGMFLVRCHSSSSVSPPDPNNNQHHHHDGYSSPHDADLPPPPLPARGPREGWPQVKERCPAMDLPLLRFSPLLPPDGYLEPREGGKM